MKKIIGFLGVIAIASMVFLHSANIDESNDLDLDSLITLNVASAATDGPLCSNGDKYCCKGSENSECGASKCSSCN